jgi:hypothetical protein
MNNSIPVAAPVAASPSPVTATELLPIPAWPFSWPSQAAWRHLVFRATDNGLLASGALVRAPGVSGRWLINARKFWTWCESQGAGVAKK